MAINPQALECAEFWIPTWAIQESIVLKCRPQTTWQKLISKDANVADLFSKVKNLDHYDDLRQGRHLDHYELTYADHSFRPRSRSPVPCPRETAVAIEMI